MCCRDAAVKTKLGILRLDQRPLMVGKECDALVDGATGRSLR